MKKKSQIKDLRTISESVGWPVEKQDEFLANNDGDVEKAIEHAELTAKMFGIKKRSRLRIYDGKEENKSPSTTNR